MSEFLEKMESFSLHQKTKTKLDFIGISILLEGFSGLRWRYREEKKDYSRWEGQLIACFRMFLEGLFSSDKNKTLRVDAAKLLSLSLEDLENGLQSGDNNPLIGLEQRLQTLVQLGGILKKNPTLFGSENPRFGNILHFFLEQASCHNNSLSCQEIFQTLQKCLRGLWPGAVEMAGVNLGDTWIYPPFGTGKEALIPFHRHSQWLCFSFLEPLVENGLFMTNSKELTGLADFRNGGMMLDSGLLEFKDPHLKQKIHHIDDGVIVEWRALTLVLLDELAPLVAEKLGKSPLEFPLAKVLEGGIWWAAKILAQKLREDASPPLKIAHNGFLF